MEITVFKSARNTKNDNMEVTWDSLCDFMEEWTRVACHRSDKLNHHAMIFGRCCGPRNKSNIQFLSGLCADFDLGPADPRYVPFDDICDILDEMGFAYIAYTTTKSETAHNKFRLILPYARDIPVQFCAAAWHRCNEILGGGIDASTKDEARLSFLPADWQGNIFHDRDNLIQMVNPFVAFRCNRNGNPILTDADITGLATMAVPAKVKTKNWNHAGLLPILSGAQSAQLAHNQKRNGA